LKLERDIKYSERDKRHLFFVKEKYIFKSNYYPFLHRFTCYNLFFVYNQLTTLCDKIYKLSCLMYAITLS